MVGVQFCCSIEAPEAIGTSWEHAEYRWIHSKGSASTTPRRSLAAEDNPTCRGHAHPHAALVASTTIARKDLSHKPSFPSPRGEKGWG